MLQNYGQFCARIGSPNSAMVDAERAITRARRNIGLILRPVERERNVSAVAFADDQHLASVSVTYRSLSTLADLLCVARRSKLFKLFLINILREILHARSDVGVGK